MLIEHRGDRSIADTDGMRAVTGRRPWVIRSACDRGPDGYDVDHCVTVLRGVRDPVLITSVDAETYLGIPRGTVRSWASRGLVRSYESNANGRPLYDAVLLADLRDDPAADMPRPDDLTNRP